MSYLLSHNLPRGFLPELVHTTCDDSDTFRRVRQLMFLVTLKTNDNQEFRILSWKKIKFQDEWWFVVYQEDTNFQTDWEPCISACPNKASYIYIKKKMMLQGRTVFSDIVSLLCVGVHPSVAGFESTDPRSVPGWGWLQGSTLRPLGAVWNQEWQHTPYMWTGEWERKTHKLLFLYMYYDFVKMHVSL